MSTVVCGCPAMVVLMRDPKFLRIISVTDRAQLTTLDTHTQPLVPVLCIIIIMIDYDYDYDYFNALRCIGLRAKHLKFKNKCESWKS